MNILFSIITVSYNAEDTIKKTIDSITSQKYEQYELIVKDGMSNDRTIELIPNSPKINMIAKSDLGIYDAMNQAACMAKGKYLIFMNCGDIFANDDVLKNIAKIITSEDEKYDVYYGDYMVGNITYQQTEKMTDFYLFRTPLCHQSMIINRKKFFEMGIYNINYRILADYDFTLKCWMYKKSFKHIKIVVCNYLGGGVSESKEGSIIKEIERNSILKKYYSYKKRIKYNIILMLSLRKLRIWIFSGNCPQFIRATYRKVVNIFNGKY